MDKGSGSGSGIFQDPDLDPGDPKRPDPTGSVSGSATLILTIFKYLFFVLKLVYCPDLELRERGRVYPGYLRKHRQLHLRQPGRQGDDQDHGDTSRLRQVHKGKA